MRKIFASLIKGTINTQGLRAPPHDFQTPLSSGWYFLVHFGRTPKKRHKKINPLRGIQSIPYPFSPVKMIRKLWQNRKKRIAFLSSTTKNIQEQSHPCWKNTCNFQSSGKGCPVLLPLLQTAVPLAWRTTERPSRPFR